MAGRRARQLTGDKAAPNVVKPIWEKAARQMLDNAALSISLLSGVPEDISKRFMMNWVSVGNYADQMHFWMSNEYIPHFSRDRLPKQVYGENTRVYLDRSELKKDTFNLRVGCSIDGVNPDLGPVNGPYPIKRFEESVYVLVTAINNLVNADMMETACRMNAMNARKANRPDVAIGILKSICELNPNSTEIRKEIIVLCLAQAKKIQDRNIKKILKNEINEQVREIAVLTLQRRYRARNHRREIKSVYGLPLVFFNVHPQVDRNNDTQKSYVREAGKHP